MNALTLDKNALAQLDVDMDKFDDTSYSQTQRIGEAVEWMGYDGFFIPSARAVGQNLVIFPIKRSYDDLFQVIYEEILEPKTS